MINGASKKNIDEELPVEVEKAEEAKPDEPKDRAFKRISSARVNRTADDLRILSKCSDLSRYEFTEDDVNLMFDFLQQALDKTKGEFMRSLKKEPFMPEFTWEK